VSRRKKIAALVILILGITCLHYLTNLGWHRQHIFYRDLYFFPIFLAGFWFGLKGALMASLSVTAFYLPFTIVYWSNFSPNDFNNVMQMILFNVVAVIIGLLVDRQKAENERLREAENLATMGKACSALAHDIKTPLVAIGGFSRLVQKKLSEGDPNREKLEIVVRETERLENMLKEVLDFSRPLELKKEKEDVNRVVEQALSMVEEVARGQKVKLENRPSPGLPEASVDKMRMEQVMINLLVNAIQATPEGGTVSVSTSLNRDSVGIHVSDCGCGIPDENKQKIFIPFFSTKKEGSGMGLPIVKKVVEAHRGRLEIENNAKGGVTFTVMIPLRSDSG
jgi:two-component system sensor histidine kinase HydH